MIAVFELLIVLAPFPSSAQERIIPQRLAGASLDAKTRQQLKKLAVFPGTRFTVRLQQNSHREAKASSTVLDEFFASNDVAQMIDELQTSAHWKHDEHQCLPGAARIGIVIVTLVHPGRARTSEERRTYDAAQALRCYLFAELGAWPAYWEATQLSECPGFPRDGIVIELGAQPAENERLPKLDDPQFQLCTDELQARAAR